MIRIYNYITLILYPFLIILIYFRKFFNKEDPKRFGEKIFLNNTDLKKNKKKNILWVHGASVGEIRTFFPVINYFLKKKNVNFLITTSTLSSAHLVEKEFKSRNVVHKFLPLDINFLIKNFLKKWKPKGIIFLDSEIWPNYLSNIRSKRIPIALFNARITKKSFRRWKIVKNFAVDIFSVFDFFLVANKETKYFLRDFKAKKIKDFGNLKFIPYDKKDKNNQKHLKSLEKYNVWCAASIHPGEEVLSINTHLMLKKNFNNVITVLIPRHLDNIQNINKVCYSHNLKTQIWIKGEKIIGKPEVIIVNSFGAMNDFFKYCKSVFIGKSTIEKLKNDSGQNPIEAARLGCRIYHGEYISNFRDIYSILKGKNISSQIKNSEDLFRNIKIDFKLRNKLNKKRVLFMNKLGNQIFKKTIYSTKKLLIK